MLFFDRLGDRTDWDYRDYCDHRSRLKRRVRLRTSIVVALLIFTALGLSLVLIFGTSGIGIGLKAS